MDEHMEINESSDEDGDEEAEKPKVRTTHKNLVRLSVILIFKFFVNLRN